MAGITAQQIMRRKYGILVRHVVSGGNYLTEVIYDGKIVCELQDDCLASGSLYQTQKIWRSLPCKLFEYPMQSCFAYLPGKNVTAAVASWNRDKFETELKPLLDSRPELSKQMDVYRQVVDCRDETETYELYDVLVRLYLYVREHNIKVVREGIRGLTVVGPCDALTSKCAPECIELDDVYGPALRHIYPTYNEVEDQGKLYLVHANPLGELDSAQGGTHVELSEEQINMLLTAGKDMKAVKVTEERGGVDSDTRQVYVCLVANILRQGGQAMTPEEKELVQYRDRVVAEGLVGKNATVGLGKVFGEGPLSERLDAGFRAVCLKARHLDGAGCYKLAASRLAGMNSAKTCAMERGVIMLRDRIVSGDDVGGSRVGLSH